MSLSTCTGCGSIFERKPWQIRQGKWRCSICRSRAKRIYKAKYLARDKGLRHAKRENALRAHFWSSIKKTESCWLYPNTGRNGYGATQRLGEDGRIIFGAHRIAWLYTFGPIPNGMFVCHHCDVRNCVNPDHLFLGTNLDNMRDMIRKGRARYQKKLLHLKRQELAI